MSDEHHSQFPTADSKPGFWKALIVHMWPPMIVIAMASAFAIGTKLGFLPSSIELGEKLLGLFRQYGLPLVIVCAFIENLVGFNGYFPGSIAIITAMAQTSGDVYAAVTTYFAIYLSSVAGNLLSYYFGWLQRKPNQLGEENTLFWKVLLSYWHPQLASLTAYSAGVSGTHVRHLLQAAVPISLAWSLLFAVALYQLGLPKNTTGALLPVFAVYLAIWCVARFWTFLRLKAGQ